MAEYCANNWDGACEYASNDGNTMYPNTVSSCNEANGACRGPGIGNSLSKGEFLLRNTAAERFLVGMSGNCRRVYEPFDPTVASSPMISKWYPSGNSCAGAGNCNASNTCIPIYDVKEKEIDNDVVMNKILNRPWIALDILINIYNHRLRTQRLGYLQPTKIGKFFFSPYFQKIIKEKLY
jgi:hypothetical protein